MSKVAAYSWRWFSAISFLSQFLRVPVLLSVASHAESLTLYFLVTLASIPFQFLALEVFQYRKRGSPYHKHELGIIVVVLAVTLVHILLVHGIETLAWYLIFGISLLLYGTGIGRIRSQGGAHRVLFAEAISGAAGTVSIALAAAVVPEHLLSKVVLSILAATNFVIFILVKNKSAPLEKSQLDSNLARHGILPLTGILISTQLERLVLGTIAPTFLTVISLAAGLVQAWRKVGMDDAIVFESLSHTSSEKLGKAMSSQQRRGFAVFLPPVLLSIIGFYSVPYIHPFLLKFGILKSLSVTTLQAAPMLMALYMASLPAGIVMINMLRDGRMRPNMIGTSFLIGVIVVEISLLVFSGATIFVELSPWLVVGLTASLNLILYRSLFASETRALRYLYWLNVIIYFLVVLWTVLCSHY
ncbi:hypothetical protein SRABI118_00502 [Massilia sp. Bi118]|uniref:hypothetical protein n=1 Tax=Massilia sp. Bi118 TaxID=2822346 RepID=UPI001D483AB6|nr:hypothetical protein [Massilia sp. Bi118]CAH0149871.1 hypothetical protein SRABI118_00502 [Massilia sp. Bi118]